MFNENYLTKNQISNYEKDGFIIIKNIFKPWIKNLRIGFNKVLANPGIYARENISPNISGRFFEDYCNWQRISEFKKCIEKSPGAKIVAEATKSKSIQIFHDHIFLKDPKTKKSTPWHQDMSYYCLDGDDTGSYWIPLDHVDKENTLQLLAGSHKWPKLLRPTKWSNNKPWYKNMKLFMDMPNINSIKNKIIKPKIDLGDAILFNFKTVHGSSANNTNNSRRAFSMRFIGDDVKFLKRSGVTSPPYRGINLKSGEKMRKDWFPIVWNS